MFIATSPDLHTQILKHFPWRYSFLDFTDKWLKSSFIFILSSSTKVLIGSHCLWGRKPFISSFTFNAFSNIFFYFCTKTKPWNHTSGSVCLCMPMQNLSQVWCLWGWWGAEGSSPLSWAGSRGGIDSMAGTSWTLLTRRSHREQTQKTDKENNPTWVRKI